MPWCVRSLKIVGEGLVEVSNVCSHEFDLGHFEDFVIVNPDNEEMIKVLIFSNNLFEMKFFGEKTDLYTMHFVKIKDGMVGCVNQSDYNVIAKEYKVRTGKDFKVIQRL